MSAPDKKAQKEIDRLLSIPDIAEADQVSERTVRRWLKSGDLVGHLLGRQWRIAPRDHETFLKSRRMG